MASVTQRHDLAQEASDPRAAATLAEFLARAAARFGPHTALQVLRRGEWMRLTYAQLHAWSLARAQALGLVPGEHVLLVGESSPEWAVAYFAAMQCGATVVPLDPQLSIADLQALAVRTQARVWLLSPEVASRVRAEGAAEPPALLEIGDWAAAPAETSASGTPIGHADDIASLPFTSGTTLAPKGVPLTHANFLANVRALTQVVSIDTRDQFLSVLPLHHVLAFTASLLAPLSVGATVTYVEKLAPKGLLEAMQASGTTVVIAVPRLLALLVRGVRANLDAAPPPTRALFRLLVLLARFLRGAGEALPPLAPALRRARAGLFRPVHRRFGGRMRFFVSGGAALPPEYFDALDLFGFRVCEGYGLTETSPVLTLTPPDRPRRGTVGPPVPGIEVRIIGPDAEGVGEVLARGASVFGGYFGDDAASARAFQDGWFRTGDLGHFDAAGYLRLAGRADDVIVTGGGKNVYPVEVEWLYRGVPYVKECCVLGLPDPGSAGEAVHIVVVVDDAAQGPPPPVRQQAIEEAITHRARQLPPHQRIRGVHFWPGDLPRTSTLKIKRRDLRARLL